MKRAYLISAMVLAPLLLVSAVVFWSLGAVASEEVPQMRIEPVQGIVEWKTQDQADWMPLTQSVPVHVGDRVRTAHAAKAEIRWADRGVTRIDEDTELTIEKSPESDLPETGFLIKLNLSTGRVWSRMLKLLDSNSGFEVSSVGVVATVRGTSFGVHSHATTTDLAVTDSVVRMSSVLGDQSYLLREGRWGSFSSTGTPMVVRDLRETDTWPQENKQQDAEFDRALQREIEQRYRNRQSAAPAWLRELSERAHLVIAADADTSRLETVYMQRRLADAVLDPASVPRLRSWMPRLSDVTPQQRVQLLRDDEWALFFSRANSTRPSSDVLIDTLVDLRTQLLDLADQTTYAQAVTLDDRIDAWIDSSGSEQDRLDLVEDIDAAAAQTDPGPARDKLDALRERVRETPSVDWPEQGVEATTSTTSTSADLPSPATTSSRPVVQATSTPPTPPAPSSPCTFRAFLLGLSPATNIYVGDQVQLRATLVCSEGMKDVRHLSTFSSGLVTDGRVSENVFVPAFARSMTLYATYQDGQTLRSANATITVLKAQRILKSVSVGAVPTKLTTGQSAPLSAVAHYSDDTSSDVVFQCAWSVSDPKIGSVFNQRFFALSGSGGTTQVACTYAEGSAKVIGSVQFTVTQDPALTPNGTTPSNNVQSGPS